ncbi:hypothetical protein PRIPAC_83649 [Pristionchus pacificus]|uniref:Uncharacterized protein n=1 Tax=Pristionchus pacificus TaxID=54126 RepID=A0A2A6BLZ5_PRIPA|nr:hypothetical protein PRIPAC_83649 [Pristionchus pacificus]|eukprot:PDM66940.1 hypothetical protein PRIPAC_48357 [Pristionchus pacificus]
MSTLSEKMRILSDLARTKATKVNALELRVMQFTCMQFQILIITEEGAFFVDNSNQFEISERMKPYTNIDKLKFPEEHPQTQIISEVVANRFIDLADRFDAKRVLFEWVSIDNHIVRCIEHLTTSRSIQAFGLKECVVDENLTKEGRTRLLATLLFIKPTFLYLWCYSLHIDELFIKEYADAVPSADFYLRDNDLKYVDPEEAFKDILWKYHKLSAPHIVIDVKWVMPQILRRLYQKTGGGWWFVITRQLTQERIEADLPADLQHTFSISDTGEDIFSIEIVGTIHKAIICPSFVENGIEWMLTVHFK